MSILNLPAAERPRERCLKHGAHTLSLRELLGVLIGSGTKATPCLELAEQILQRIGAGLAQNDSETAFFLALEGLGLTALSDHKGLGPSNQARILAAFEIGRRYATYREVQKSPRRWVRDHLERSALNAIPDELRREAREWLGFVPVLRSGRVGDLCLVERGVRTHVNVDPAELFARVLALRPAAIFLFHNHPSGDLTPSSQDHDLTERVANLCRELGMRLMGHGIVSMAGEAWIK